ncbi:hypothetical protein K466DRAFT_502406 [Polyporus arcularius HHB13444]|uniref:hAT-like transposase RNase-H fold domain-containing protein n=1 Tax=Polyporus arcularius HHB13444 TaxID=1314778 RepID=A0A5C3NXM8_9APHY|nr:hypothetical protein K466DRAFT_502406 [Polyporus arcularius HHB13444]
MCSDAKNGLRELELDAEEWEIAKQLRDALEILKHAMLFLSRHDATIASVLPVMEYIQKTFSQPDEKYNTAIRVAFKFARKTLLRYYNLTDMSSTYRIAMILHPKYKTSYFKKTLNYSRPYIEAAKKLVRDEFNARYAKLDGEDDESESEASNAGDRQAEDDASSGSKV